MSETFTRLVHLKKFLKRIPIIVDLCILKTTKTKINLRKKSLPITIFKQDVEQQLFHSTGASREVREAHDDVSLSRHRRELLEEIDEEEKPRARSKVMHTAKS